MLFHAAKGTAPSTNHIKVARSKRSSTIRRCHINDFHGGYIHTKMHHLLEKAIMSRCSQRNGNLLAFKLLGIVFGDFKTGTNDAIIIVRIRHGHIHYLEILPCGSCDHERWNALRKGYLNVTGSHCSRHGCARIKRYPFDGHTEFFRIDLFSLSKLVWCRPFQEIRYG